VTTEPPPTLLMPDVLTLWVVTAALVAHRRSFSVEPVHTDSWRVRCDTYSLGIARQAIEGFARAGIVGTKAKPDS
jgi:hypothetical protein